MTFEAVPAAPDGKSRVRGWHWWFYLLEAVLLGVPTALVGGLYSVVAVIVAVGGKGALALVLLGAGGIAGIVGWLRLSVAYLFRGLPGLRACARGWWVGLLAGIAAFSFLVLPGLVEEMLCRSRGSACSRTGVSEMLVIVLMLKPYGLFGSHDIERL